MSCGRGVCSKVCSIAQQHKERLESEHQHAKAVEEWQRGHATAVTRQRLFRAKAKFIRADCVTLESSGYAARQRQEELNVHFYSPWTRFKLKTGFFVLGLYKTKQNKSRMNGLAHTWWCMMQPVRWVWKWLTEWEWNYICSMQTLFFFPLWNTAEALVHPLLVAASADLQLLSSTLLLVCCHHFSHWSLKRLYFNF